MKYYFNGLNGLSLENDVSPDIQTSFVKFYKVKSPEGAILFEGKIKTYDRFTTKKPITLNVKAEQHICSDGRSIIVFRFSPMEFDDDIWDDLGGIGVIDGVCDRK